MIRLFICWMIPFLGLGGAMTPTFCQAADTPRPYLMLVTFGAPTLREWTEARCAKVNGWPYAGIASIVVDGYNTDPVPSQSDFESAVKLLRTHTRTQIWPWVFLNRMIGRGKGEAHTSAPKTSPYFERINGWDLEDKVGARADFLALWRLNLQLAKDLGAPGIVLDLETYNDYNTYQLSFLAEDGGWSSDQTIGLLKDLGRKMARIVEQEYPSAVIWSFFTGLGGSRTTGYVCEGFLEESVKRQIPTKLIDGGETTVGYYNPSAAALINSIHNHASTLEPFIRKYQGHLAVGGTIAPYHEPQKLTWWILDASKSGGRIYANMDEFRPNFDALFARCEYVWIYGASAAHCVPFDESNADTTSALHRVLGEVYPRWKEAYGVLHLPLQNETLNRRKPVGKSNPDTSGLSIDLAEWTKGDPRTDMNQPDLKFGPEKNMTKEGPTAVRMTVTIRWKGEGASKHPYGWPMIHKSFDPPLDLSRYEWFEFWLRIHTDAPLPSPPLKFGFSNEGKEPVWQDAETDKKDEWVKMELPLDRIGAREKITRLTFYVSDAWYRDGDVITFYLDGLRFMRQTTPQIGAVTVDPFLLSSETTQETFARFTLLGDAIEQGCHLRWGVKKDKSTRVQRKGELPVTAATGRIAVSTEGLDKGAYTFDLELLDAKGRRLDTTHARFAILRK